MIELSALSRHVVRPFMGPRSFLGVEMGYLELVNTDVVLFECCSHLSEDLFLDLEDPHPADTVDVTDAL